MMDRIRSKLRAWLGIDAIDDRLRKLENVRLVRLSQNDLIAMGRMGLDPTNELHRKEFARVRLEARSD